MEKKYLIKLLSLSVIPMAAGAVCMSLFGYRDITNIWVRLVTMIPFLVWGMLGFVVTKKGERPDKAVAVAHGVPAVLFVFGLLWSIAENCLPYVIEMFFLPFLYGSGAILVGIFGMNVHPGFKLVLAAFIMVFSFFVGAFYKNKELFK